MFSVTVLNEVTYLMSILIQDFKFSDKMSVKITIFCAVTLCSWPMFWGNTLPPSPGHERGAVFESFSIQPQFGRFVTRHNSFSTDANKQHHL